MGDSDHHIFNFRDATAELGIQPASAPAGSFPLLVGIDGRYGDVLRRYPGHKRYPDTNAALGCTATATVHNPTFVQPFEIQKQSGSLDKIRGFVVYDESTGGCEFWYKFSTDAAGVIRKYNLLTTGGLILRALADPSASPTPQPTASGIGELPAIFNGSTYTAQEINALCVHADGNGTNLYAAGIFRFAGDRHCQCIAKWDGTRWTPLPDAFFNGGAVNCLLSYSTGLFVGGAFTSKGSSVTGQDVNYKYVCCWDGAQWSTLGGGVDATVRAMVSLGSGNGIILGGDFGNVSATPGVAPATASPGLAKWQPATSTWTVSGLTFTAGFPYALEVSGATLYVAGTFTQVNAVANTARIASMTTAFAGVAALGTGIGTNTVFALKMIGTDLYVGGSFTGAGGVANTARIALWSGAAWGAVNTGFSAGTVRSIDSRAGAAGHTQITITGHGLTSGAFTSGLWWTDRTAGPAFTAFAFAVNMGTIGNFSCQVEWGLYKYYGGQDQGSNLSLNPLASELDSTGRPTGVGPKIDVAYHDRYIFLLASNGVKKTIYWDASASTFKVASFGPGLMYADGITGAGMTKAGGSGNLATGAYATQYRYFDPDRMRWTALSAEDDQEANAAPWYIIADQQTAVNELNKAPDGFTKSELFSTISSTDTAVPAGGTKYRVARGSINSTTRRSTIWHGATAFVDYGNGEYHWALTDDAIPDPSRTYDLDIEETGELGDVYAAACFQGMTFALEGQGGYLVLRWTNSFRTEWENFAPINGYQTGIRAEDAWSCKFDEAGDYLYLRGGDQVYVIQRIGVSVRIVKVFSGLSIIHRQASHVVGNQLFILTQQGLLIIDPRSSQGAIFRRLDRVFWDRWRGFLTPADTTFSASMGYDAQMECLYIHNTVLKEAICLWLNTGKVSILLNTATDMVTSFPDIDTDQGERAYFFTNRRWFSVPQWTPSQAATMQGDFLESTSAATNLLVKYNWTVSEVVNGDTNCPNYGQSLCRLKLEPTAPAVVGTSSPFTTDGTTANTKCVSPMAIMVLSGAAKGRIYQVVGNTDKYLWLAGLLDASRLIVAGDVIALAPVTTFVMSSMMWDDKGRIRVNARKKMHGANVTVSRISSTGDLAQTTPVTGTSLVQFGLCRQDNFTNSEPSSSTHITNTARTLQEYKGPNDVFVVEPYGEFDGPLNAALSTSKEASNWGRKVYDGTICFPFLMFRTSNYNVEVLYWDVLGEVTGSQLAGPGTL